MNPQQVGEELLGQPETIGSRSVVRHQKPAGKALLDGMQSVASDRLQHLNEEILNIAEEQAAQRRAFMRGIRQRLDGQPRGGTLHLDQYTLARDPASKQRFEADESPPGRLSRFLLRLCASPPSGRSHRHAENTRVVAARRIRPGPYAASTARFPDSAQVAQAGEPVLLQSAGWPDVGWIPPYHHHGLFKCDRRDYTACWPPRQPTILASAVSQMGTI